MNNYYPEEKIGTRYRKLRMLNEYYDWWKFVNIGLWYALFNTPLAGNFVSLMLSITFWSHIVQDTTVNLKNCPPLYLQSASNFLLVADVSLEVLQAHPLEELQVVLHHSGDPLHLIPVLVPLPLLLPCKYEGETHSLGTFRKTGYICILFTFITLHSYFIFLVFPPPP